MFVRKLMILLCGLVLISTAQAEQTPSPAPLVRPAKLLTIEDPGANQLRTFPAEVKATARTELAFRVSGELIELNAQEGEEVQQGQLLARLDPADYKVVLQERQAQYRLAKAQYDRFYKMLQRKLVSDAQYDEKKAELDVARASLSRAQLDLKYTELHAPYTGTVSQRLVENYQNLQAKQPVLIVQSGNQIDIQFQISESIMALQAKPDARLYKADVTFDALPGQTFKAAYRERTAEADRSTGSYTVTLTMTRPETLQVHPGMTAAVTVDLNQVFELQQRGFVLPVEAVFSAEDQPLDSAQRQIWKVNPEDMTVFRANVQVGALTSRGIEILSGLAAGDTVVGAGVHHLKEGMKVRRWIRERGL